MRKRGVLLNELCRPRNVHIVLFCLGLQGKGRRRRALRKRGVLGRFCKVYSSCVLVLRKAVFCGKIDLDFAHFLFLHIFISDALGKALEKSRQAFRGKMKTIKLARLGDA